MSNRDEDFQNTDCGVDDVDDEDLDGDGLDNFLLDNDHQRVVPYWQRDVLPSNSTHTDVADQRDESYWERELSDVKRIKVIPHAFCSDL